MFGTIEWGVFHIIGTSRKIEQLYIYHYGKKISVSLRYPIETQDRNVICHFFTTVFLPFGDCYRGMGWVYHGLRRKHHPPAYPKNSKQPWVRIVHSSGKLWHMLIDCPNLNKANLVMSSFTKHKFGSIVPKSFYFPDLHAVCMYLWVSECYKHRNYCLHLHLRIFMFDRIVSIKWIDG
jgi:hypothetical protein